MTAQKTVTQRAQEIVGAGNPLADLFLRPTREARKFLATLSRKERHELEATAGDAQKRASGSDVC